MPVTLQDIQMVDNGARFYAGDLQIHSFGGSADVVDPSMTVEAILDAAVTQGFSIISITDHNSDKNTQASLDYAQKYAGQLLVLPGVEITTANGHLLVYFPPERAAAVRDLLARIIVVGGHGARDSHTTMSMATVINEAEKLGGISIAAHIDRTKTGFEQAIAGYPNAKKDILVCSGLYGLEFDAADHLAWYSPQDEPTPDGAERKKLLNARRLTTATAARVELAALQNSDAHSLADFKAKKPITRFKLSELSFEALRTALIDPEARVRPVVTIPPSFPRVVGMRIDGGFLDAETFHFSSNLNSFIGGRGTGKSTALQSVAYGLGASDKLEDFDNCPDQVVIYCQDADGTLFRYERTRGREPVVKAKEDQSIKDVPPDSFRIEFFAQGDLAEVAKDPLRNATLLQEFLDRHIVIQDLQEREGALLLALEQNSTQLVPVLSAAAQLPGKRKILADLDVKLKIAETGKVKEIAAFQIRLAAEKGLAAELSRIAQSYAKGLSLAAYERDFGSVQQNVGQLTGDPKTTDALNRAKQIIDKANLFLREQGQTIKGVLAEFGQQLNAAILELGAEHKALDEQVSQKIADLRKKGLSGNIEELNRLIKERSTLAAEVARIESQALLLKELKEQRLQLLADLKTTRQSIVDRRKAQLSLVNKNLTETIRDYAVNLYYEPGGITEEFKQLLLEVMQGTHFQENTAEALCLAIAPQELAQLVENAAFNDLAKRADIGIQWATLILQRFQPSSQLHRLETIWKPPRPVIKVLTRGGQPKQVPVNQLSDGQKHTILLTIAMLAESNLPLVIDQPEDDLDNAFIFGSIVSTLRKIKERRQVILVTHNANIAVLGDSELILPMRRHADRGVVFDRGSIDRGETKQAVQEILEGGEMAFRRRQEIYGH